MTAEKDAPVHETTNDAKHNCERFGLRYIDLTPEVEESIIDLIDAELAVRLRVLPIQLDRGRLSLAMLNPVDIEAADEVATMTGLPVTRCGMEQRIFSELDNSPESPLLSC